VIPQSQATQKCLEIAGIHRHKPPRLPPAGSWRHCGSCHPRQHRQSHPALLHLQLDAFPILNPCLHEKDQARVYDKFDFN
jgi:hypothetical protein